MGVTAMRFLIITAAATILMLPTTAPTKASDAGLYSAQAVSTDYSAKKHKPKVKKEKVEYMRAAPM
jgi:hypothetical protein